MKRVLLMILDGLGCWKTRFHSDAIGSTRLLISRSWRVITPCLVVHERGECRFARRSDGKFRSGTLEYWSRTGGLSGFGED